MGRTTEAKEKLIKTALDLIWNNSYHSIGVNDICQRAGVKPGSFYYFFPSKQDLVLTAMEFHWGQAKEGVLDPSFSPDIPPLKRIEKLFERVYKYHAVRQKNNQQVLGCAFGSFVGELGEKDEIARDKMNMIFSLIGDYFESALSDAVVSGDLKARKKDLPGIAKALVAYYEGVLIMARAGNDAKVIRDLSKHALKLVIGK